ncbi:hypothetical protein AB0J86_22220 [Micromonospora sp. NPDC049559]|uniref:hypothetical protein n=1 Tax=Micromonospora sp. NPDC049559 TaxID=3155923 RepID=UPI003446FB6F
MVTAVQANGNGSGHVPPSPPPPGSSWALALVARGLVLGGAALLLLLGFVLLPYAGIDAPPRDFTYAPVRYLEFGAVLQAYETRMNLWGRLYSTGLAPLIALLVWLLVAASVAVVALVPRYRTRPPWWPRLVFAVAMLAALAPMAGSPVNGTILLTSSGGYLSVLAAHLLLPWALPLANRKRQRRTAGAGPSRPAAEAPGRDGTGPAPGARPGSGS